MEDSSIGTCLIGIMQIVLHFSNDEFLDDLHLWAGSFGHVHVSDIDPSAFLEMIDAPIRA